MESRFGLFSQLGGIMRRGFFGLIVLGLVAISTVVWAGPIVVTPGGSVGYMYFPVPLSQTIKVNTGNSTPDYSKYTDYTITSSQAFNPPEGTYAIQYLLVGGGQTDSPGWAGQIVTGLLPYERLNGSLIINVGGPGGNTTLVYNGTTYTAAAGNSSSGSTTGSVGHWGEWIGGAGYGGYPGLNFHDYYYDNGTTRYYGAFNGYGGVGWGVTNQAGYENYPHGTMRTDFPQPSSVPSSPCSYCAAIGPPSGWGAGSMYAIAATPQYLPALQGAVILRCYYY
jgi:hypothetical protein